MGVMIIITRAWSGDVVQCGRLKTVLCNVVGA